MPTYYSDPAGTTVQSALVQLSKTIREWLDREAFYTKPTGKANNLYELNTTGVYYIPAPSGDKFTDRPSDFLEDGMLIVNADGDTQIQILINYTNLMVYFRTKATNENSFISKPWEKVDHYDKYGKDSFSANNTAKAISAKSAAFGFNTQAGSYAFTVLDLDATNKTFTLDSTEGLDVGDVYTVDISFYKADGTATEELYANYGKITAISADNVVTVDTFPSDVARYRVPDEPYIDENGLDGEENVFRVIAKPNVGNRAIGTKSFAIGNSSQALSKNSVAMGKACIAYGAHSAAIGYDNKTAYAATSFGRSNTASGVKSVAIGYNNTSSGEGSIAFGNSNTSSNKGSFASGTINKATGTNSFAAGHSNKVQGKYSIALGYNNTSSGEGSTAFGNSNTASNKGSFASGTGNKAIGTNSFALGSTNRTTGTSSFAHGYNNDATQTGSAVFGTNSKSQGQSSFAAGAYVEATGDYSQAFGYKTKATGRAAFAEGEGTIANGKHQHVQGKYNIEDTANKYAYIIGNGSGEDITDDSGNITTQNRSNAHTLDWEGNTWFAGDVTIGKDKEKLVTEAYCGYSRDIWFIPYEKDQNVLFHFDTSAKTLRVRAIRFMLPKMVDITSDTVLSYDGITTNPNFLVFDCETTDKTQYLKIVKRDELKSLKTRYSVILTFNLQNLANTANVSYKGPYSVDGVIYNNPEPQKDTSDIVKYVNSNSGSDLNTGDNTTTAYQTIMKAVNAGATIIRVAPGTYPEYVNIASKKKIQIICNFGSTDSKRNKVIISDAISCAFLATNISALYSFSFEDANMKQAFNNDINNINAYTSYNFNNASNGRSNGYIFNLWRKQDNKKIIPIKYQVSYATDGLPSDDLYWTYDTENNLIYTNAGAGEYNLSLSVPIEDLSFSTNTDTEGNSVSDTNTIVLKTEKSPRTGINLKYIQNVVLEDIVVDYAQFQGISISGCNNVNVSNCEAKYSSLSNGFAILDTNGIFNNCNGSYNRNDGINITGCGNTIFNDCHCENNGDDGISHHAACTGTINGGYFTGNGKGGVSPAHGAMVNCINAISIKNKQYGFYVVDSRKDTTDYGRRITLNNCYAKENDIADIIVTNYNVNAFTCNFGQIADFIKTDITSLTQYS